MDKPWKVISAFVGVFIAGAVFGGLFTLRASGKRLAEARPAVVVPPPPTQKTAEPDKQPTAPASSGATAAAVPKAGSPPGQPRVFATALMRQMMQRLNPTPEQNREIRRILSRMTEDIQRYQAGHLQDVARATDRMYEDVSLILSTDQRTELERMRYEAAERARKEQQRRSELQAKASANAGRRGSAPEGANPPPKD